jgi:hypothetical protein
MINKGIELGPNEEEIAEIADYLDEVEAFFRRDFEALRQRR